MSQLSSSAVPRPTLCPLGDGMIFTVPGETEIELSVDGANPEVCSTIINDPPLMLPNDKKLLDLFTIFCGIPRRCFQALFSDEEELEYEAIKNATNEIESI